MKRITVTIFFLFLFSSCRVASAIENQLPYSSDSDTIKSYSVYEDGYEGRNKDSDMNPEFNNAMAENPIDKKMNKELEREELPSTREQQVFYDNYAKLWQNELDHSLDNLKKYLTIEDKEKLIKSQELWTQSLEENKQLDLTIIGENQIELGTQFISSALKYLIGQYKDRVFHIKYMTYLVENYTENSIDLEQQTWNNFTHSN